MGGITQLLMHLALTRLRDFTLWISRMTVHRRACGPCGDSQVWTAPASRAHLMAAGLKDSTAERFFNAQFMVLVPAMDCVNGWPNAKLECRLTSDAEEKAHTSCPLRLPHHASMTPEGLHNAALHENRTTHAPSSLRGQYGCHR